MTTLQDRPGSALLVIDVQNGVVADSHNRDEVVENIRILVERARSGGTAVVWVQHADDGLIPGSSDWQIVSELQRDDAEALVEKHFGDAFEDTNLESILALERVGRLVVVGAQTDACIRSTLHGAFTRGYDVTLVGDAHTTEDRSRWGAPRPEQVIAHTNMYWNYHEAPGREAATVQCADVQFP